MRLTRRPARRATLALAATAALLLLGASTAAAHAAQGKARPRRLDESRPQLTLDPATTPRSAAQRRLPLLTATVTIDERGQPDMATLRVTGLAAAANRDEIERWIGAGRYEPARDRAGTPVRGEYRFEVAASSRTVRVP
jgi:hypothetical protein